MRKWQAIVELRVFLESQVLVILGQKFNNHYTTHDIIGELTPPVLVPTGPTPRKGRLFISQSRINCFEIRISRKLGISESYLGLSPFGFCSSNLNVTIAKVRIRCDRAHQKKSLSPCYSLRYYYSTYAPCQLKYECNTSGEQTVFN